MNDTAKSLSDLKEQAKKLLETFEELRGYL
jgi:hypothetical protein